MNDTNGKNSRMSPLYTEKYFKEYLRLSIAIFSQKYSYEKAYREHPNWNEFISLLREAGVKKIFICVGMMIGDISVQYFCSPITENSPSEEFVRNRYCVYEEIDLRQNPE